MIGPTSSPSSMPGCELIENPVGVKRKVFEELDIESLCEEVCQSGKKRFLTELRTPIDGSSMQTHLVDNSSSGFSSSEAADNGGGCEGGGGGGPVARLEVLVVDGTWDSANLGQNELTEISSTIVNGSSSGNIQSLHEVQSVENGYGTILSYWSPASAPENPQSCTSSAQVSTSTEPAALNVVGNTAEDQENGNLSWLLDFKLDSLIEATEDRSPFALSRDCHNGHRNRYNSSSTRGSGSSNSNDTRRSYGSQSENVSSSPSVSTIQQEARQPMLNNGSYALTDSRNFASSRYGGPKKPPYTYTELIEHALQERGELTVSAIYQWISEHFPYYKSNDDRWKNSVRHNLSINPHFRKGSKAPHGAGHLWAIANRGDMRPRQFTTSDTTATTQRQFMKNILDTSNIRKQHSANSQIVTLDEVAAATASISQPEETHVIQNSVTLEHCAGQILSGIKREVEVQYLVPMVVPANEADQEQVQIQQTEQTEQQQCPTKDSDFLNPVSKEEVAEECGLIGESYLVTDLNPTALGLSMVEPEIITPDNLFGEELSFQFYELTSPSQLQSA